MVQKVTIYPSYSSARTMPTGCCPCAANFYHITPVLKDLHWLPVEQKLEYKVLLLTYKTLHGKAPEYISQLLSLYTPTRPLRSEKKKIPQSAKMPFGNVLVDAALRMPLHPFGTLYLHLLNVPLSLIPSIAAWRLIYLIWRIPRSTESYIVWVYCLWLVFSLFYLQALLSAVTSHHFF